MKRIVKAPNTDLKAYSVATKLAVSNDFPEQNAFINDKERFIAAQCSRRAGKSTALAFKFLKTMEKNPKSTCIYLALTRDSAKDIMWPVLEEINEKYKLNCVLTESKLTMTHPNGATLKLYGADMVNFIRRLKGQKSPGVAIDESQDFGVHLQSLVVDVLTPMLIDYADSWLAVVGTPGPVPQGYFFDVTQQKRYGYSLHKWTINENPHITEPEKFIQTLITNNEWEPNHPTLLREWRNQWVLDVEALWIRYKEATNHYTELPKVSKWNYVLGIDIGFKDADALAVLAWSDDIKETYLVEEVVTTKQDITSLVEQIEEISTRYDFTKMVIDQGGLGLKIAEEIRRRKGIPIHAADKKLKAENVGILNDELRLGKFKAKGNSRFAQDSYMIQIDWAKSTPDKIVIKKEPHSDILDAVLYAFRETYAYAHKPAEPAKPKWGTREWAESEQRSMFDKALEEAQAEQERKREYGDFNE